MNLTISGHHLEVTPSLRSYVMAKLERILRHFDQVVDVKVLLTVHKQKEKDKRQRAGCTVRVKGQDLFVETQHFDLYAAVDWRDWSFQLNANNVTDKIYYSTCLQRGDCFLGVRRTVNFAVTRSF